MGKRQVVIVSSSSEEDLGGNSSFIGSRSSSKSKMRTRTVSVSRKRPRGPSKIKQKASKELLKREEVGFDMLSEDFYECLNGLHTIPDKGSCESAPRNMDQKELWVDKHKPRSLSELAVHKKKVEEVRRWLEDRVSISKDRLQKHALIITGQAGVGKSAAIHVIASQLGAKLYEWRTPTPTLWQEHIHNSNSGIRYMSKLDEFETFIEQIRKYPLLSSTSTGGCRKPVILLIDDLPLTHGRASYGRLCKCLQLLVHSTCVPTVILITENCKDESSDSNSRYLEELEASLETAGACKVSFNALTVNSIKKTLHRICQEEKCSVTGEWIDQIAKVSGGDIRQAITTLQYFCLRQDPVLSLPLSSLTTIDSGGKSDRPSEFSFSSVKADEDSSDQFPLPFGRDEILSLFHALGKFLHNKRETGDASGLGENTFLLQEKFARSPLKMDAPEKVLWQAHAQARPVIDFLHENVLDFLSDEAIDNAWSVTSYLSDADCLLATALFPTWKNESENLSQLAAASVSVRGVLFGNSQPSPSKWHAIRRPKIWQLEQSSRRNKNEMLMERSITYDSLRSCSICEIATEYRPTIRFLRSRMSDDMHLDRKLLPSCNMEVDNLDLGRSDNVEGACSAEGSEEDEIEDWPP